MLYLPGLLDLQPYETRKLRICSESAVGALPDLIPEMLNRTRGTFKFWRTLRSSGLATWGLLGPLGPKSKRSPNMRSREG